MISTIPDKQEDNKVIGSFCTSLILHKHSARPCIAYITYLESGSDLKLGTSSGERSPGLKILGPLIYGDLFSSLLMPSHKILHEPTLLAHILDLEYDLRNGLWQWLERYLRDEVIRAMMISSSFAPTTALVGRLNSTVNRRCTATSRWFERCITSPLIIYFSVNETVTVWVPPLLR